MQSLRSIETQGESVSEDVVIDHAFSDGSIVIVKTFANDVSLPIRIIHTSGVGQYARLHFALKIATAFPDNRRTHSHHIRDLFLPGKERSYMLDYASLKSEAKVFNRLSSEKRKKVFE